MYEKGCFYVFLLDLITITVYECIVIFLQIISWSFYNEIFLLYIPLPYFISALYV